MLYSVIIPVFNTELHYVKRALDSVVTQTKGLDAEILIVDDGSETDYSEKLDEFDSVKDKVIVLHKQHDGLSDTRNYGVNKSAGEYIAFLDADDELATGFFDNTKELISKYMPDVIYGVLEFLPESRYSGVQANGETFYLSGEDIIEAKKALFDVRPRKLDLTILGSACGRLYKRELFDKVSFRPEVLLHEDQVFNREVLNVAESVLITHYPLYRYYQHSSSMIHNKRLEYPYLKWKEYWNRIYQLNIRETCECQFRLKVRALGQLYSYLAKYVTVDKKTIHRIEEAAETPLFKDAINELDEKDSRLTKTQKIVLRLLKNHRYRTLFLISKIKNNENK